MLNFLSWLLSCNLEKQWHRCLEGRDFPLMKINKFRFCILGFILLFLDLNIDMPPPSQQVFDNSFRLVLTCLHSGSQLSLFQVFSFPSFSRCIILFLLDLRCHLQSVYLALMFIWKLLIVFNRHNYSLKTALL